MQGSKSIGNLETHSFRAQRPDSRSDLAGALGSAEGKRRKGRKDPLVSAEVKVEGNDSGKGTNLQFLFQSGSLSHNQSSPETCIIGRLRNHLTLAVGNLPLVQRLRPRNWRNHENIVKGKGTMRPHGSKLQALMSHFETRKNNDTISRNASTDLSKPHHDLGVVRPSRDAGLEPYLPANASEQKARVSPLNRPCLDGVAKP